MKPEPIYNASVSADMFWPEVGPTNKDGCRIWQGMVNSKGYGVFKGEGRMVLAHRMSWTLTYGDIPKGKLILHRCDIRACCEPSHLYLGTYSDNTMDRIYRNPNNLGGSRSKLYAKDIIDIRSLKTEIPPNGRRELSSRKVASMYGVSCSAILRIWNSEKYLCREGYYI
jgi:hypothetical protein